MKPAEKVVITCAITGSIHTPTMSPYLPITPEEIARESVAAAEAGAAIVHLHARNPEDGSPTADPDVFMQFLPEIRAQSDVVVNITTGGGPGMTMDERLAPPVRARPEFASLNMGTLNFGVFPLAAKYRQWKHPWEQPFIEGTRNVVQMNTFAQIEEVIRRVGIDCGTRFEYECYDVGHLYNLAHFADRGLIEPPFFIQCIMGILGGIGVDAGNLVHMRDVADKLFGDDYYLSCFAIGRQQMQYLTMSAILGGSVRVGLEDSLYIGPGELAKSNADQVTKVRGLVEGLGLQIATPDEARAMLGLKGKNDVAF